MERQPDNRATVDMIPGTPPRSLGAEIIRLPLLYLKAIFTPSARFFAGEGERASWGLIWIQILLLILIPAILGFLRGLNRSAAARAATNSEALGNLLSVLTISTTLIGLIVQIFFVPLLFFFGLAVEFLIAKAFRGRGRFVWQGHATLLYQVPLAIISSAISTIFLAIHLPLAARLSLSPIINLALFIYGLFLNILAIEGVHRLTRGRATLVVIITYAFFALLIILLLIALARLIISALHNT
jgi:Yip1 domain